MPIANANSPSLVANYGAFTSTPVGVFSIVADELAYSLTVSDVNLLAEGAFAINADPFAYALAVQDVTFVAESVLALEAATYSLTVADVAFGDGTEAYTFNLTAGDGPSSVFQGYSSGAFGGAFGSIDAEPIAGHTLVAIIDALGSIIAFSGDCTADVAGKTVWVDSVQYPFENDWSYDGDNDITVADWSGGSPPDFTNTVEYFVEIK